MGERLSIQLDHIAIGHPNLERAKEEFADLTGCMPSNGGPHLDAGTHNASASLGDSVYIELISPDPKQIGAPSLSGSTSARIDDGLTVVGLRIPR